MCEKKNTCGKGHLKVNLKCHLPKMSLFRRCFSTRFANANQLPGFYIVGTLTGN